MAAQDNLNPHQFTVHGGKYAISYEPGSYNTVQAQNLDGEGQPTGRWIGYLNHDYGGTIGNVHVRDEYQRQGIATAMLNHAQAQNPDMTFGHSTNLTGDGSAWSKASPL